MDNATILLDDLTVFRRIGIETPLTHRMDCSKMAKENADPDPGENGGITVKSVGVRWYHPGGFLIDRPGGLKDYTFVQWLTPTILRIDGKTTNEDPGGCIFYPPDVPQWYAGDVYTPFGNNWFHFTGPSVPGLLEQCGLPLNRPIRLRNGAFIEESLRLFLKESMSNRFCRELALSAHALLFLVEFGRILHGAAVKARSARNMELREKFEIFREQLRERCTEQWTLGRMAAELHLSISRFSNLYREFFAAKPVDDLIRMRLELAGYYLRTTVQPVNYVANLCGFTDIYYFSRAFKAKMGLTPTAFRTEN